MLESRGERSPYEVVILDDEHGPGHVPIIRVRGRPVVGVSPTSPWSCKDPRMIGIERSLRHLQWTDARLFGELAALPPDVLLARYGPDASTVGDLARHIVGGAEWYAYCLAGEPWTDLSTPETSGEVRALGDRLARLDALLIEQSALPDERVTFEDEDGPRSAMRSTILSQACLHAIEHRAQIACALEVNGFPRIDLDSYDLWAFEAQEGQG